MNLDEVRRGLVTQGIPERLVGELLEAYAEAKRRHYLEDHRPQAVEGGHFSEAAFRVLQHLTTRQHTPLGSSLPRVDDLLTTLSNVPQSDAQESVRLHIPRTLRLIYDVRNKRDIAHLGDDIDPNLMDSNLVIGCMDWIMAEFLRLHHDVPPNEAQTIIEELVTKEVPAVQEVAGQPVILKDLQPRDQALLMLYRAGSERGATSDEIMDWLREDHKGNLNARLRRLDELKFVLEHPKTGRFHITARGIRDVEERRLAQPINHSYQE